MKRIVYLLGFILVLAVAAPQGATAQNRELTKKELRKLKREKKREARKKENQRLRARYMRLLKNKQFVFEAQKVYLPAGPSANVATNVNFIAVHNDQIVVQFDFTGLSGSNGLGGVTARGKIEKWHFDPGKNSKQAMTVSGQVTPRGSGRRIFFTITVTDDGLADAQITLRSSTFRLTGLIASLKDADVVIGSPIF
ncbi:DUF4251 domain-containing protein [Candidatus Sulfidibacterium hydrothermale]|uniref:DUF4251 domain-containing protein n=1 Tax=Candidatus Sulfidibacterium hydrothermale TaxID=2875962 RepID=UPI001F0A28F7|nr:DUF4251 domain-containing protein [Candidatus Sulfidibacterium hydrothermale]UBM61188.1 DUF4251 domain-containing protein [Candidatus Sulfidibacterium hydrothermale]